LLSSSSLIFGGSRYFLHSNEADAFTAQFISVTNSTWGGESTLSSIIATECNAISGMPDLSVADDAIFVSGKIIIHQTTPVIDRTGEILYFPEVSSSDVVNPSTIYSHPGTSRQSLMRDRIELPIVCVNGTLRDFSADPHIGGDDTGGEFETNLPVL
jgi:hypothetical protein